MVVSGVGVLDRRMEARVGVVRLVGEVGWAGSVWVTRLT